MKKTAGEIMISLDSYPYVSYDTTLWDAMSKLTNTQFEVEGLKSLPRVALVFNEKKELVGMVRRRDFLRGLDPEMLREMLPIGKGKMFESLGEDIQSSYAKVLEQARSKMKRPVSDVMTPIKVTVDCHANLLDVICEMVAHNLSLIPVLKDGQVVGVVRTVELVLEACRILDHKENKE